MKKLKFRKLYIDFTLVVVLIGTLVFATGFGLCLYMSRTNTEKMMEKAVQDNLNLLYTYIDGQLNSVENMMYSFCWADNKDYAVCAPFSELQEYSISDLFESVLNIDSLISGVAVALAPPYRGHQPHKYGYALYCANNKSRKVEILNIGDLYDYTQKPWYHIPMTTKKVFWTKPFFETSKHDLVTSFSLPLVEADRTSMVGVLVVDISMERFQNMCSKILPYRNSKTVIIDEDYRFICHPDSTKLMKDIDDESGKGYYAELKRQIAICDSGVVTLSDGGSESLLYYEKVPRTGWTIGIECPEDEIFRESNALGHHMLVIAIISIILMTVCFHYLYKRLVRATTYNADIQSDLNIATKVQMSILPKGQPALMERKDIDLHGFLKTAMSVGGDLYDYMVRDDKLFFCIGDVSGKGVPASLFMFAITTFFHSLARTTNSTTGIVSALNEAIASNNKDLTFCTLFVGILDLKTGILEYCNAGHDGPVVVSTDGDGRKSARFLEVESNIATGILGGYHYREQRCRLQPGDIIFLFTDGVTEAKNADGKLFGLDATLQAVRDVCGADTSIADKVNGIYEDILKHTAGVEQSDDITMLMVRYNGKSVTLENDVDKLPELTEFVKEICNGLSVSDDCRSSILVAADEIGSNIAMYAYPDGEDNTFTVRFRKEGDELVFTFEDSGVPFDPTIEHEVDTESSCAERSIGGLGIFLTQQLMDRIEYRREAGKNILTVAKVFATE